MQSPPCPNNAEKLRCQLDKTLFEQSHAAMNRGIHGMHPSDRGKPDSPDEIRDFHNNQVPVK
jgi:hypothetical protein